jgi:NitT/TauT family transport system ATP-binding protein
MEALIEMKQINKVFTSNDGEDITVLENINLTINKGEIYCLLGPSGCGKSTILKLLAGFDSPTQGKIYANHHEVKNVAPDRAVVFQTPNLFPWLTVYENITFGLKMKKIPIAEVKEKTETFIQAVGLTGYEQHYPYQLSGGMQQRVSIARALVNDPTILLMDEPFAALDAQTRLLMQELVMKVWEEFQTTILFITHDIDEAIFLGNKIGVMSRNPGKVTEEHVINIQRPRSFEVVTTKEFTSIKSSILSRLQHEVHNSL